MRTLPLRDATPPTSGSKAATLATLLHAGVDVPDGFVIPMGEYRRHHPADKPGHQSHRLEPGLIDAVEDHLDRLLGRSTAGYVAVRSSASDEDGHLSSSAGQHDTVLAVRGAGAVAAAVARCWDSLHSERANAYRQQTSAVQPHPPAMAVLVQRFVDADASGVLFTQTPRVIEATPGIGADLVGGQLTPDAWTLDNTGIISRRPGHTSHRLDRRGDQLISTALHHFPEQMCLDDSTLYRLDQLGQAISITLGYPADVEWAITGQRIHTLQARPITASLAPSVAPPWDPSDTGWHGIPASPGQATSTTCVLNSPRDFHRFTPGEILICRATDPAWTPLFRHAAGIITETGGLLSHAAIVARELRIPAILSVPRATTLFPVNTSITMDGTTGLIYTSR